MSFPTPDIQERLGKSIIQHGHNSQRVYLMKLDPADMPDILSWLDQIAARHGYSKIFAKVQGSLAPPFLQHGYIEEGRVPQIDTETDGLCFVGKFFTPDRRILQAADAVARNLSLARHRHPADPEPPGTGFQLRHAVVEDAPALAALYRDVFKSYPFPIFDPDYLKKTMEGHILYQIAEYSGQLVAAASAEFDPSSASAELSDFATLPDFTGNRLATHLLTALSLRLDEHRVRIRYTIARALSAAMNITFARCGYTFGGTLVNNTQIAGAIESMNLWYRIRHP